MPAAKTNPPDGVVYTVALCQLGPGAPESRLETDLPERLVRGEEGGAGPAGDRRFHGVPLAARPVLVVAGRDEQLLAGDQRRIAVHVDVGQVGDIVAVRLDPLHQFVLEVEELARAIAVRVRPIERDLSGVSSVETERIGVEALAPQSLYACQVVTEACTTAAFFRSSARMTIGRYLCRPSTRISLSM